MSDDNTTLDKVEEIKAEVIEKYGLDVDDHEELIEQLTNDALDNQKKLSKAIDTKAKYRQQLVEKGLIDPETFEPIEKADAEQEKKPEQREIKKETNQDTQGLTVEQAEDLVFLNTGGTKAELEVLRTVTRNEGKSLAEAKGSEYFTWWKKNQEDIKKNEEAQLNASTASRSVSKKQKPLTREEHMEAVSNWKPSKS